MTVSRARSSALAVELLARSFALGTRARSSALAVELLARSFALGARS